MTYPVTPTTRLVIDLMAASDYATRGLEQSLTLIGAATNLRRNVNGSLIDLSLSQFRKYRSRITGKDQVPPAFDGLYPGVQVVVSCLAELSYKTSGGSPARTVVGGSSRTEGAFTYYRPQLTMRVVTLEQTSHEWTAEVNWVLELEEV